MEDNEQAGQVRKDGPVEKPKKLPAAFPDKFDIEQDQKDKPVVQKKRGKGARFHGSM